MYPLDENIAATYSQYELRVYSVQEKLECLHSMHSSLYKSVHFHHRRKQVYYTEITSNALRISPSLQSECIPYFHLLVNDAADDDSTRTNLNIYTFRMLNSFLILDEDH
jgi:hypothetical protein